MSPSPEAERLKRLAELKAEGIALRRHIERLRANIRKLDTEKTQLCASPPAEFK
jgi:hypothetical protein